MQRNIPRPQAPRDLADPPAAGPANARGEEAAAPGQKETNPPPATDSPSARPETSDSDADWHTRLRELYSGKH